MESKKRWMVGIAAGIGVVIYCWDFSPAVVFLGPLVACGAWVFLGRMEPAGVRKSRQETLYALPQALDLIQACLKTGQPLRTATQTVSQAMGPPVSGLLGSVTSAISVGMSDDQAWQVLTEDPTIGVVARDIARSTTWGTAITDVLAQHSADLRRFGSQDRLKAAKQVGVKSVMPLGICYLPAFALMGVVPVIAAGVSGLFG
jgi:pilus assembly protein TadC